ncbi:MAG: type II 3-dehydroquinate dehydratase [Bacillota bacterium]|nr:type II 3-dehydroquinate dehydratase [Bacillota bacterium]
MASLLVINGPNLNLLGVREPENYGTTTLKVIEARLRKRAEAEKVDLQFVQSNHEGELIDCIHQARVDQIDCMIVNAAAYSHYSIAIYDALKAVQIPFIEVHLSNIYKREETFRHTSLLSPIAVGGIFGFGAESYDLAFEAAMKMIRNK